VTYKRDYGYPKHMWQSLHIQTQKSGFISSVPPGLFPH